MMMMMMKPSFPIHLFNRCRRLFPMLKQPGHEADHPPPSRTEVKNAWNYTSTSSYVLMV